MQFGGVSGQFAVQRNRLPETGANLNTNEEVKMSDQRSMRRRCVRAKAVVVSAIIVVLGFVGAAPARAQEPTQPGQTVAEQQEKSAKQDPSPQAPSPQVAANPKNDRIFKVIPNYTTVEVPTTYVPLTVKEKFKLGAEDAFDPYSFPLAGIVAGIAQATNEDASWGQGWGAFGKRYAAGFADTTLGSFMSTGVFPSLTHEDPRYFREGHGGFLHRSGHALKKMVVTRTDSDHREFNYSEFGGNAVAAALSLTYHTRDERTVSSFESNYATQLLIDVIANQLKEFWPDMRRKMFGK